MTAEPARIDYATVFPAGLRAMVGLQRAVDGAGLEPLLLELVKMRASQINGCALRGARADLRSGGDRRADPRDRGHQRLEPAGDIHAHAGWLIRVTPPPNRSVNHAYCTT
jgi:hypothetical protein